MISTKQIFFSNPIVCEMIKSNKKTILNYSKKNKFNLKIINSIHYDLIKKIDNNKKIDLLLLIGGDAEQLNNLMNDIAIKEEMNIFNNMKNEQNLAIS